MVNKKIEQLALEERREYFRNWRAANKDKVKEYNQKYWKKRAKQKSKELEETNNENN
jgi:hypothetical protein